MLRDATLKARFAALLPGEVLPADPDAPRSPVQPSSIDLTVGNIYLPDVPADALGGVNRPRTEYNLPAGHTAVVITHETLDLPSEIAAIGFPPTRMSNNGILMTNPGHVDPGFRGKLSFTVINMGREPFDLRPGDRVVTLVFFTLDGTPDKDYEARNPTVAIAPEIEPQRLARLSPDMLDVDQRIAKKVTTEESRTKRWGIVVPFLLAAIVAAGPIVNNWLTNDVADRVNRLEKDADVRKLEARIAELEKRLAAPTTVATP